MPDAGTPYAAGLPAEVVTTPPGDPPRSRAGLGALLLVAALLALLGVGGAWIAVGIDDPAGAGGAAAPQPPQGPSGMRPPTTSSSSSTTSTTSTTQSSSEAQTTTASTGQTVVASRAVVPDVVGQTASRATRRVRAAELDPSIRIVVSSRPAGTVVDQAPDGGARLARGAVVRLEVARVHVETVRVPGLVGSTFSEARALLRRVGLSWSSTEMSSSRPAGTVVGQSPGSGTEVRKGSVIRVRVSSGPPLVNVPDVTGLDEADARVKLDAAGFEVSVVEQPTDDSSQDGVVLDQSPVGRTDAREGAVVTITVGVFG